MNTILIAIIATGSIGFVAAVLLTVASKLMYVKTDPKIAQIRAVLPGANCGACGFTGCDGYAAALAKGESAPDLCPPGGSNTFRAISEILGTGGGAGPARKFAIVRCTGTPEDKTDKMDYRGISSCFAAEQIFGGVNACSMGCLGYGDCVPVCPHGAVCVTGGIAYIDPNLCNGCGLCAATCPRKIISVFTEPVNAVVLCRNTEKGAVVRKKCAKGCIACTKCVRECPQGAIAMADNLAVIDSSKCDGCGKCAQVCMTKCIKCYV